VAGVAGAAGGAGAPAGGAGSAGSAGVGGVGGVGGTSSGGSAGTDFGPYGPVSCLPAFETACKPNIVYQNNEPQQAALLDQLYPDITPLMQDVTCTVCSILFRSVDDIPESRRHETVMLTVENVGPPAFAGGNGITLDSEHVANQEGSSEEQQRTEFRGILVHEAVHLYQTYGTFGLGEGNADHLRIRVGLYNPGRRGTGGDWLGGYTTTGFFFSWLSGPCEYHSDYREAGYDLDLTYKIDQAVWQAEENGDDSEAAVAGLLQQLFGSDVTTLWNEYQAAIQ
jgi:hypothetical protein